MIWSPSMTSPSSQPGRTFVGKIAFINPVLDEMTRTVKVRVNAANPQGRLKPGMFVKAHLRVELGAQGPLAAQAPQEPPAPPVAIEFCKHVVQAVLAVTGGDLQSVSAQSVAHGVPPSAPVPMHAQASSTARVQGIERSGVSLLWRLKVSVVAVLEASPPTRPVMEMPAFAPSRRIMM